MKPPVAAMVKCPVCADSFPVKFKNTTTSELAPINRAMIVFVEPDLTELQRHLAAHAVEAEEAAA